MFQLYTVLTIWGMGIYLHQFPKSSLIKVIWLAEGSPEPMLLYHYELDP